MVLQGGTRLLTLDFLPFCVLAWPKVLTRLFGPQLPASSLTDGQLQRIQQRTLRSSGMAEPQKRKVLGPRLNCIDENCPLTRDTC